MRTLALLALCAGFARAEPPKPAATVNGEPVSLADVDAVIRHTLPNAPINANQLRTLRREVTQDLIDDALLRQFLAKNAPKVDPAEIAAQLKAFGEKLARDGKTLADFYKETGQTEAQVRATWTAAMQLTGYVKSIATEQQLKAYFEAHRDVFDRVEVRVRHILVRAGKAALPTERAAAKERAEAIRTAITANRIDFAAAAKRYSQCPSATDGGDLGFVLRKSALLDEPVARLGFALKPGELGVAETEYGFHVVQAVERKPGAPTTYDKCATEVLDAYADDHRAELLVKLRKEAKIEVTLP
jgi:parvulin-like peptidyl-prolyl isomerase